MVNRQNKIHLRLFMHSLLVADAGAVDRVHRLGLAHPRGADRGALPAPALQADHALLRAAAQDRYPVQGVAVVQLRDHVVTLAVRVL